MTGTKNISKDKKYTRADFAFEEIKGEILIIDHENGITHTLNHTASSIWKLLKTPRSESELVKGINKTYSGVIDEEIRFLLEEMIDKKLII